jgi:hypothetical protein
LDAAAHGAYAVTSGSAIRQSGFVALMSSSPNARHGWIRPKSRPPLKCL